MKTLQEQISRMKSMMGLNEQTKNPLDFIQDPNYMDFNKFNYNPKDKNNEQPKNVTIDWIDSFDKITDKNKNIFLYLTGKGCYWCRVLEKEFFNTKEFYEFIKTKNLNLVKIDITKNRDFLTKFGADGAPEVFLTDYNISFKKKLRTNDQPFIHNAGNMPKVYTDVNKTIEYLDNVL